MNRQIWAADADILMLEQYRTLFGNTGLFGECVTVRTFTDAGHLPESFRNHRAQGEQILLCILETQIGPHSGLDIAESLRSADPELSIVFVTDAADISPAAVMNRLQSNVYCLKKPFENEELLLLAVSLAENRRRRSLLAAELEERRRAEISLKEKEKMYRLLAENTADVIWTRDADMRFTYCSPSLKHLLGYAPEEVDYAAEMEELLSPFSLDAISNLDAGSEIPEDSDGAMFETLRFDQKLRHKNGSDVWAEAVLTYIYDEESLLTGLVGVTRDITKRKQATDALQKSEEKLRAIFENAIAGISILNAEGQYIYSNDKLAEMLGYTKEEVYGLNYSEITHPQDIQASREYFRKLIDGEIRSYALEKRFVRKNGTVFWGNLSVSASYDTEDGVGSVIGIVIDIDERKKIEEELKAALAKLRAVFDTIPGVVNVIDRDYNILTISGNKSFGKRKIPDDRRAVGRKCYDVTKGASSVCPECAVARVFESGKPEIRFSTHEEEAASGMATKIYAVPLYDDSGNITAALELIMDISDLREMERKLQEAKQAAEAASQAKSEFLASMSHELRTPLNGILGYTQILRRDSRLSEQHLRAVSTIHRSGEHLLAMINEILDFSKLEARKMELNPVKFRLYDFLSEITEVLKVRAEQKGITLICESAPDLPRYVDGDEYRLRQILLNLIGNAVKFTEKGRIKIKADRHYDRIRFQVEDSGIGISSENQEKIFLPFHQVGNIRTKTQGTGLGLAISQKLVRMMGGRINMKSVPEQGSLFWFSIELPEVKEESDPSGGIGNRAKIIAYTRPDPGPGKEAYKILIADNIEKKRLILKEMLLPLGFDIFEAPDGNEAVEKAALLHPDLILMSLTMPTGNGYETARRIRQIPSLSEVIIIALSATVLNRTRKKCSDAGCNDFLARPVRLNDLLERLKAHLKLEWIYEDSAYPGAADPEQRNSDARAEERGDKESESPADAVLLPPEKEIATLREFLMIGDIRGIRDQIGRIESLYPDSSVFVEKVSRLMNMYKMDELQELIEGLGCGVRGSG